MKKLKLFIASLALVAVTTAFVVPVSNTAAAGALDNVCEDNTDSAVCKNKDSITTASLVSTIVNALLYLVGVVSVVMIIFGGIQFTTSQGNSANVAKAKNTITYAVIGLVVAFLAYAIINWVFDVL
jgi:hypothetical protein